MTTVITFTQLVAGVLDIPAGEVTDGIGPATHTGWTSIKQLQLIVAVEERYRLTFSRDEIRSVRSVGDLRRNLLSKGVEP
jgi:acyl carrier protein